ncbi:HD domain-containing protein [Enterococcus sp.]|uniref:HD domain-containing protein n=1 Tax=Enterococcus sp. TaxID=35783 RepID=UPI00289732D8|nr:HD domain-containing protein [Enterococcus sp.]
MKSEHYTQAERELLMQKVQMQMSQKRFEHVLGVEKTAVALAEKYGASPVKASIAALTHDYAKERSDEEFRLVIRRDGFDLDLLNWNNAIWHGLVGADFVQRELEIDLDAAVPYETKHTLLHLIETEAVIYPKTIETYNFWVAKYRRELP